MDKHDVTPIQEMVAGPEVAKDFEGYEEGDDVEMQGPLKWRDLR